MSKHAPFSMASSQSSGPEHLKTVQRPKARFEPDEAASISFSLPHHRTMPPRARSEAFASSEKWSGIARPPSPNSDTPSSHAYQDCAGTLWSNHETSNLLAYCNDCESCAVSSRSSIELTLIDLRQFCPDADGQTPPEELHSFDTYELAPMSWTYDPTASILPVLRHPEVGYHSGHTNCDSSSTDFDHALYSKPPSPLLLNLDAKASTLPLARCYDQEAVGINGHQAWPGYTDDSLRMLYPGC
jgi:hypothetical protein